MVIVVLSAVVGAHPGVTACIAAAWWIDVDRPPPGIHGSMSIGAQDCTDWCEGRQDDPRSKISPGLKPCLD